MEKRVRIGWLIILIGATLASCWASAPDLQCSRFDDDLNCPGGQICDIDYTCKPYCEKSIDCSGVEACLENMCRGYAQSCDNGESCIDGWACDGTACVKVLGNCHPDVPGMCHPDAACLPTGSRNEYECDCNTGYDGDGKQCSDIDECARGTHDCEPTAQCSNTVGGFTCGCERGYLPNAGEKGCTAEWLHVARGARHACGIRADGSLWCWGDNTFGQLGIGSLSARARPTPVGDAAGSWLSVAAGQRHSCAVASDLSLWCWGNNTDGQLAVDNAEIATSPERVPGEETWAAVAAGASHTCGVATDTSLWCWGNNDHGQLGAAATGPAPRRVETTPSQRWAEVYAGPQHTCAIADDERLWCWGSNHAGQVGTGATDDQTDPWRLDASARWVSVALGSAHTCGVQVAGTLWCWGDNQYGQLDGEPNGPLASGALAPSRIGSGADWLELAAGSRHNCAVTIGGRLHCWGDNRRGQTGMGGTSLVSSLLPVDNQNDWRTPALGGDSSCALENDGTLWCWGARDRGQIGDGLGAPEPTVIATQGLAPASWRAVSAGGAHGCAIDDSQELWCWGDNTYGQLGMSAMAGTQHLAVEVATTTDWAALDLGAEHSCGLDVSDGLWCWGNNGSGQVGAGSALTVEAPLKIEPDAAWQSVSAGGWHTCGLKPVSGRNAELWCWGANNAGQLGDAALGSEETTPARIGEANTWTAVSAGSTHTCGLQTPGTLWCWGSGDSGKLGLEEPPATASEPVQVGLEDDWIAVAAGSTQTCGLRAPGTLWCWGALASSWQANTPVKIGTRSDWSLLSAGGSAARDEGHVCGVASDGSTWCWGSNAHGQLGNGTVLDQTSPSPAGASGWAAVSAGGAHSCGIRGGALLCWGADESGQRSDSTSWRPLQVMEP